MSFSGIGDASSHGAYMVAQLVLAVNTVLARAAVDELGLFLLVIPRNLVGAVVLGLFSRFCYAGQQPATTVLAAASTPPSLLTPITSVPQPVGSFPDAVEGVDARTASSLASMHAANAASSDVMVRLSARIGGPKGMIVLSGVLGCCLHVLLFTAGVKYTSAFTATAAQCSIPVFTSLISVFVGQDSMTLTKMGAIIGVVLGNLLLLQGGEQATQSGAPPDVPPGASASQFQLGFLCLMGNCMAYSLFLVVQKYLLRIIPPVTLLYYTKLWGAISLSIIGMPFFSDMPSYKTWSRTAWNALLFSLVVTSCVPYGLKTYAMRNTTPVTASMYVTMFPMWTALLGFVFLGEELLLTQVLGTVLLCGSLLLGAMEKNRSKGGSSGLEAVGDGARSPHPSHSKFAV